MGKSLAAFGVGVATVFVARQFRAQVAGIAGLPAPLANNADLLLGGLAGVIALKVFKVA
jgi:hypothetical protein